MSGHVHAGRIAAAAHLSAAWALIECADEALREDGLQAGVEELGDCNRALAAAADAILEPCEIANVLQTVEEVVALGDDMDRVTGLSDAVDRQAIVRALVDARQAAKDDESVCTCEDAPPHGRRCPEFEPSDDEIYNGFGREGGIAYDTSGDMRDEHDWSL